MTKQEWIAEYAGRILFTWRRWQGPLGIDDAYLEQLEEQLGKQFDDPLKRQLVEMSY